WNRREPNVPEMDLRAFGLQADLPRILGDFPGVIDFIAVDEHADVAAVDDDFVLVPLADRAFGGTELLRAAAVGAGRIGLHGVVVDVPEIACVAAVKLCFDALGPDLVGPD